MQQTGTYSYQSGAKTVQARPRFREPIPMDQKHGFGNLMYDRRIVRGTMFSPQTVPLDAEEDVRQMRRARRQRKNATQPRDAELNVMLDQQSSSIQGRINMEVQTEQYLEELSEQVPTFDFETQTDYFIDQPTVPCYVPVKSGIDVETQIEDDLFDFDYECEPLLEVLIGKTLEQSLLEVLEEEEIRKVQQHRTEMQQIRNAELQAQQEMENAQMRRFEEKERRKQQQRERIEHEKTISEKVASVAFAHDLLATLQKSVQHSLEGAGYFVDRRQVAISSDFLPWLLEEANSKVKRVSESRQVVRRLVQAAMKKGTDRHIRLEEGVRAGLSLVDDAKKREEEKAIKKENMEIMDSEDKLAAAVKKADERRKRIEEEKALREAEEEELRRQREQEQPEEGENEEGGEEGEDGEQEEEEEEQ
ncbi:putative Flagellar radial spoke protein 3 [Blattamonas nauphoetae]|uniref:Flagellar radial spoke protein 3 n=1 Tax=Blattamonas nauphoetae TaxID=2049346 RepID=A0ABQ9YLH5_9EUKA|nr:putative Flagellar radial spoke protein 3 [Blattamonas nauphoetae]